MSTSLLTLATLGVLMSRAGDAAACGGPDYGDFSPVGPVTAPLHTLLYPDDFAEWGQQQRPEMRFLFPWNFGRWAR